MPPANSVFVLHLPVSGLVLRSVPSDAGGVLTSGSSVAVALSGLRAGSPWWTSGKLTTLCGVLSTCAPMETTEGGGRGFRSRPASFVSRSGEIDGGRTDRKRRLPSLADCYRADAMRSPGPSTTTVAPTFTLL